MIFFLPFSAIKVLQSLFLRIGFFKKFNLYNKRKGVKVKKYIYISKNDMVKSTKNFQKLGIFCYINF